MLAFDVILCSIGEEELGSNGRDGGHVCSGNHIDGRQHSESESLGKHDGGGGLQRREMLEGIDRKAGDLVSMGRQNGKLLTADRSSTAAVWSVYTDKLATVERASVASQ